ncbi:hypothetical protein EC9_02510 [Rosistilla ulvae]|uniref:Transposase IS200-like domain-containing protein n=1 Tax=Rosistilla ulvae TaxID=1930277 RepID=A0A517LTY4_9BACT|nr:hypothetical protein [Rosistilla ulvae]QDS86093.1 hypothetical protein EC9_02510 [Rosistilla ulvae]
MSRLPRSEVFDPAEIEIAHTYARTVRRCFLLGYDPVSEKNFDYRKRWIESYLKQFAALFGIDLLCYTILSNHFHLVLRSRSDIVECWSDREVARRWILLCPERQDRDGLPAEPTEAEINSIAGCAERLAEIRSRLSNFSWWMRLLCQRIAMRANREDEQSGHFFQGRYKATKLFDEASLLACAAYVDLNPIRAAIAETIEASDYTSIQRRMQEAGLYASEGSSCLSQQTASGPHRHPLQTSADTERCLPGDRPSASFLAPLFLDERNAQVGPCIAATSRRCSDKGFLSMSLCDYVELLDWTARQVKPGGGGGTPVEVPPVFERIGIGKSAWRELVSEFGRLFCTVAGECRVVDAARSRIRHRRFHLPRRGRQLMASE